MKSLSYVFAAKEKIKIRNRYYFGQLWDGDFDGEELLESGAISPDGETVFAFKIINSSDDLLQTTVEITDIY